MRIPISIIMLIGLMLPGTFAWAVQTCNPNMAQSTPISRFTMTTTTVLDNQTGLMWARCADGQTQIFASACAQGTTNTYNWLDALDMAANSALSGYNDWRLPNEKELISIIEFACHDPAINTQAFPHTQSVRHWTSSWVRPQSNLSHAFDFLDGGSAVGGHTSGLFIVRIVRDGS